MKPRLFETAAELISFIDSLPVVPGTTKGADGELTDIVAVITKLKALVPDMFRYRDTLVKSPGGLGNLKSLRRYSEAAAENISNEFHESYEMSLNALADEVENLINMGVSEEMTEALRSAKSAIAQFQYVRSCIEGFKGKLQSRMSVVEANAQKMADALKKVVRTHKDESIRNDLNMAHAKLERDLEQVQGLIKSMDQYCDLQITYHSILISASKKAA